VARRCGWCKLWWHGGGQLELDAVYAPQRHHPFAVIAVATATGYVHVEIRFILTSIVHVLGSRAVAAAAATGFPACQKAYM